MIYIDTGAFVARYLSRDQYHKIALQGWDKLARNKWPLVTSSFVVDETVTLLARRVGARFAAERARAILSSARLTIVRPEAEVELAAVELLEKFEASIHAGGDKHSPRADSWFDTVKRFFERLGS